jgi:hypothetical protein
MGYLPLVLAALLANLSSGGIPPRKAGPAEPWREREPIIELPEGVGIKPGVILRGLDRGMHPAIDKASRIWRHHGRTLVITSGLDGRHSQGSRHYSGRALDFRSRDLERSARNRVVRELRRVLGRDFLVLLEKDHIHVEYAAPSRSAPSRLARTPLPRPRTRDRAAAELAESSP